MSPHQGVPSQFPTVLCGKVGVFLHLFPFDFSFFRFVFRPFELVFRNAVPKEFLRFFTIPFFHAVLLAVAVHFVKGECRAKWECVPLQFDMDFFSGLCLYRKVGFAQAIDARFGRGKPLAVHGSDFFDFHVVHLQPAFFQSYMEGDVIHPVALLVGEKCHRIGLPFFREVERGTFLLAVIRWAALDNRVDGDVSFGFEC